LQKCKVVASTSTVADIICFNHVVSDSVIHQHLYQRHLRISLIDAEKSLLCKDLALKPQSR